VERANVILGLAAAVWTVSCSLPPADSDQIGESSAYAVGENLDCTGTVRKTTITGDVRVARGNTCFLTQSQVGGSVEASEGSTLIIANNTSVQGHVRATAVQRLVVVGVRIGLNLESHRSTSVVVISARVGGEVVIEGTSGNPFGFPNAICQSSTVGNMTIKNSAGAAQFSIGNSNQCSGGNVINGDLKLDANDASVTLDGNTVQGTATCTVAGGKPAIIPRSGLVNLPGGSCGTQTCVAGCNGQLLTSCDQQANATLKDCSAQTDSSGNPMTCNFLEDQQNFDCIADFSGGCGTETMAGRCDGTKLIHCLSDDSGNASAKGEVPVNVETVDCSLDPLGLTTCAVASDGIAGCAAPGTLGCGEVTADGSCNGDILSQCVNSSVQTTDCSATGKRCGLASTGSEACLDASLFSVPQPVGTVTGTFVYQKKTVDTSTVQTALQGFRPMPALTPVRRALVRLLAASDNRELERSFTKDDGSFTLDLADVTVPAFVTVATSGDPERYPLIVRDCPRSKDRTFPCTDKLGNVYVFQTSSFTGSMALGQMTITEASGLAGAFNIFDLMLKGQDFARDNLNNGAFPSTPELLVEWKKGSETTTSLWSESLGMIIIQGNGTGGDTDEFDDPVLMHEFGHFLQSKFSKNDSPGGPHNGSPTDPLLAFGEGYGTYIGCRISGSSIYFDTDASGTTVKDINNIDTTKFFASLTDKNGIKQLMSEYVVAEILWRIDVGTGGDTRGTGAISGQSSAPVFDVLSKYFKDNSGYNNTHGVKGRDLVKFLDGWFCRDFNANASASTTVLQGVVTTDHNFPYDDFTHDLTPIGSCK
jgi:hypothetical protein